MSLNKKTAKTTAPSFFSRKGAIAGVVFVAVLLYFYFLGMESTDGPIQVVDVEKKVHTIHTNSTPPITTDNRDPSSSSNDSEQQHHAEATKPAPRTSDSNNNNAVPTPPVTSPVVTPVVIPVQTPIATPTSTQKQQQTQPQPPPKKQFSDITNLSSIWQNIQLAKQQMIQQLHHDYGKDDFQAMFFTTRSTQSADDDGSRVSRGRMLFQHQQPLSWQRMQSKLQQKILQVLIMQRKNAAAAAAAAADVSKKQGNGFLSSFRKTAVNNTTPTTTTNNNKNNNTNNAAPVRFVWATGGHSSTAGHGNYYDESYTAVLERTVRPVFAAAGIDFEGRNYAMGGMDSAPETAWCVDSIFGATDPDVLIWDHGMTDGNNFEKLVLYFYRGAKNPNRPICIANHMGMRMQNVVKDILKQMEDNGLGVLYSDEAVYTDVIDAVPDSLGKSQSEIEAMPLYIRNFKCGKQWEAGDPYCGTEKFNETFCPQRRFKTSWHQGWKWHAIQGNLAALFLVEVMEDAVKELQSNENVDPKSLLALLQDKEKEENEKFLKAPLPPIASRIFANATIAAEFELDAVFKAPIFCHTAKVPAEIRHKGILMQTEPGDLFNHFEGPSLKEVEAQDNDSDFIRLVRDDDTRQKCNEVRLNIDHKDFFYLSEQEGWKKLVLPNDAELAEYGAGQQPLRAHIAVCFTQCPWGKCQKGMLDAEAVNDGRVSAQVNGKPVTELTPVENCHFLKGSQGQLWPVSSESSKFEISFRVNEPESNIRIGTVALLVTESKADSAAIAKPTAPEVLADTVTEPVPSPVSAVVPQEAGSAIPGPVSVEVMARNIRNAKEEMIQDLYRDYGKDNFESMFMVETDGGKNISRGRVLFQSPSGTKGPSWDRLQSKLQQKLLQVLIRENESPDQKTGFLSSLRKTSTDVNAEAKQSVRFVWATGGHSSTAGHGNYFDESYTAVLESTVRSVFAAAGIEFEGRNFAMGGTASAPETAWCVDSIFGANDPDVLVWDHGMTDGNNVEKMVLYFYRAALNRNRPICIANHMGGRAEQNRAAVLKELEDRGLGVLMSIENEYKAVIDAVPDSLGKTEEEIQAMPPFIRNFKCGKQWEAGDPYCGAQKYNETFCSKRRFKTSWHQGWKWHAMQGKLAALFLVEVLEDAVKGLQGEKTDPKSLLRLLADKDDASYDSFFKADLPDLAYSIFEETIVANEIDLKTLFKAPCFCHTAKVPAEIRHKGILTQTDPGNLFNYTEGISVFEADTELNNFDYMRLVREDGSRQKCDEVRLNIDHKDFFYVSEREGWKKVVVPNDAELAEYGTGQPMRGLVAVCFTQCPWGKCEKGQLNVEAFAEGKSEMQVNGKRVVGLTSAGECHFLKGEDGHQWPVPSGSSPKFEVSVRVTEPDSNLRIGTIVVF